MISNLLKWKQTIIISWSKYTAYRFNFFLQIIGPSLVFFFIKYNLWSSIYQGNQDLIIMGYNFKSMIQYHAWGFIVFLLAQGHASFNLSEDIRLGRISSYLIYPFNFWEFHTASFISFQILQIIITTITIIILFLLNIIEIESIFFLFHGLLYSIFVSFFWYNLQYFTGLLAFWLEETWIIRVTIQIISSFLSGAILPLELYPNWLASILKFSPFPYLSYYPIKIFSGSIDISITYLYLFISVWILIFILINNFIWKKGLRLYTAAGM